MSFKARLSLLARSKPARAVVVGGAALASVAANAAIDVTTVTTAITDAGTAIATVGAAYLAMRVGGRVFKWIQSAL